MKTKKVNIQGFYIDLSKVASIDTSEDEFKITLYLDSGVKIEKEIPKIDPYKNLEFRPLNKPKDKRDTELVMSTDTGFKAYRKEDVKAVLDKEKAIWDGFKDEILKKWGEL